MAFLLHQHLTANAGRAPGHTAVVCTDASLTYEELDRLSNQLAHVLKSFGVEGGDRVGIFLTKSVESIVAMFGIMKAGAAYVPLDPNTPVKRVAFIAGNCAMKALVSTEKKAAALLAELGDAAPFSGVVLVDEEPRTPGKAGAKPVVLGWSHVQSHPHEAPGDPGTIEEDLAYILYTSGSTGEPKGVMISHRASLTFVDWAFDTFDVTDADRLSNHAPLHFDLSTFDIFVAIKAGATVIMVPEELSVFPKNLADFIEGERITVWYSVPSVLTRLVLHGKLEGREFRDLRAILFAGEVFPVKHLGELKSLIPGADYYNLYGPTETNVCTFFKVEDIPQDRVEPLPIGRACANTQVFAVNDDNRVAEPGEVGELYVRGPSLMKGYWGLPEKTSTVLIPDTVQSWGGGGSVYRTGDQVKLSEEGDYLFIGRRDHMIKSRGYRIELGEIESTLYKHPDVQEVAVVAIPDEEIGNAIKAVIVPREGRELTKREAEVFCSQHIPKYMIPGIIEFRPALPKTSTGKTDKAQIVQESQESQPSLA